LLISHPNGGIPHSYLLRQATLPVTGTVRQQQCLPQASRRPLNLSRNCSAMFRALQALRMKWKQSPRVDVCGA
jgi:hypothetical protein